MDALDHGTSQVSKLLDKINTISKGCPDVTQDESARATLLQASRELTTLLEQPDEVISNVAFSVRARRPHPTTP